MTLSHSDYVSMYNVLLSDATQKLTSVPMVQKIEITRKLDTLQQNVSSLEQAFIACSEASDDDITDTSGVSAITETLEWELAELSMHIQKLAPHT